MEPARTERANNPDADKVRVGKIVRHKDKVENVAVVARVEAAVADRARGAVAVAWGVVKIPDAARPSGFNPSPTQKP